MQPSRVCSPLVFQQTWNLSVDSHLAVAAMAQQHTEPGLPVSLARSVEGRSRTAVPTPAAGGAVRPSPPFDVDVDDPAGGDQLGPCSGPAGCGGHSLSVGEAQSLTRFGVG